MIRAWWRSILRFMARRRRPDKPIMSMVEPVSSPEDVRSENWYKSKKSRMIVGNYISRTPTSCVVCHRAFNRAPGQYRLYCSKTCRRIGRGGRYNRKAVFGNAPMPGTFAEEVAKNETVEKSS